MFPFEEIIINSCTKIRTFKHDTDSSELAWHRDRLDRRVRVLESNGWFFQREDHLPVELSPGQILSIPARSWHRIIRKNNSGDLVVEITE